MVNRFEGPEWRWLVECIDANFVSAVGARGTMEAARTLRAQ
jgi:hypothetical protein